MILRTGRLGIPQKQPQGFCIFNSAPGQFKVTSTLISKQIRVPRKKEEIEVGRQRRGRKERGQEKQGQQKYLIFKGQKVWHSYLRVLYVLPLCACVCTLLYQRGEEGRRKTGKEKIMGIIGLYFNLCFMYLTQSSLTWFSLIPPSPPPPNNKIQCF